MNIREICNTYSSKNWDGYGANPISIDSSEEAERFLKLLSSSIPYPEIIPEPCGEVGVEWFCNRELVFAISFSGRRRISYAGIFNNHKVSGNAYFNDAIPSVIIENIKKLYNTEMEGLYGGRELR